MAARKTASLAVFASSDGPMRPAAPGSIRNAVGRSAPKAIIGSSAAAPENSAPSKSRIAASPNTTSPTNPAAASPTDKTVARKTVRRKALPSPEYHCRLYSGRTALAISPSNGPPTAVTAIRRAARYAPTSAGPTNWASRMTSILSIAALIPARK